MEKVNDRIKANGAISLDGFGVDSVKEFLEVMFRQGFSKGLFVWLKAMYGRHSVVSRFALNPVGIGRAARWAAFMSSTGAAVSLVPVDELRAVR